MRQRREQLNEIPGCRNVCRIGPLSVERVVMAVELVRQRLLRATGALERAKIPYAVAGGNAVARWASRVDVSAVRNTSDVDLLVHRADLQAIQSARSQEGFALRIPNRRLAVGRN